MVSLKWGTRSEMTPWRRKTSRSAGVDEVNDADDVAVADDVDSCRSSCWNNANHRQRMKFRLWECKCSRFEMGSPFRIQIGISSCSSFVFINSVSSRRIWKALGDSSWAETDRTFAAGERREERNVMIYDIFEFHNLHSAYPLQEEGKRGKMAITRVMSRVIDELVAGMVTRALEV